MTATNLSTSDEELAEEKVKLYSAIGYSEDAKAAVYERDVSFFVLPLVSPVLDKCVSPSAVCCSPSVIQPPPSLLSAME